MKRNKKKNGRNNNPGLAFAAVRIRMHGSNNGKVIEIAVVIALPTWKTLTGGMPNRNNTIPVGNGKMRRFIQFDDHPLTLSFARTYHKLQGQTKRKLILDVGSYPGRGNTLRMKHFYVGLSRTRSRKHLRFLPIGAEKQSRMRELQRFTNDKNLQIYLSRFNENGSKYKRNV